MSPAILLSIAAAFVVAHAIVCLYALAFPADVARELSNPNRSFVAWIYIFALRHGRGDMEMDLQSTLDAETITANCRRRAIIGLAFSGFSLAMLGFFISKMASTGVVWR